MWCWCCGIARIKYRRYTGKCDWGGNTGEGGGVARGDADGFEASGREGGRGCDTGCPQARLCARCVLPNKELNPVNLLVIKYILI